MSDIPKSYQDSPWKEILEQYFPEFLAFFFPEAYVGIDWAQGYTFLDKELQQVVREAEVGVRRVDKLAQVYLMNGEEAWVLVHVEIQGQQEADFAERMYIYNYRLFDRYKRKVVSLAVLTDDNSSWRPNRYIYELFGCRISLDFPTIKLLDYEEKWDTLAVNVNPFAVVVMAHLKTQATRQDPAERYTAKLSLAKMLYQRGYRRQDILELFRFIDWIMTLPTELSQQFQVDISQFEEEVKMPYVTTIERMALQEGRQEGRQEELRESILNILEVRFGAASEEIMSLLQDIEAYERLRSLHRQAITIESPAAFMQFLTAVSETD